MAGGDSANLNAMKVSGLALVGLAIIVISAIAVLTQFKTTGLVDNTTADAFITGFAIFGSFSAVLVLGIMAKALIGMFKGT